MAEFLQLKNEVIQVFDDATRLAQKVNYDDGIQKINKLKDKLNKNELTVVVCGEIKRGKSSLLSALLEEVNIFPINVNVATNVVTVVRYGTVETIEVGYLDGSRHEKKNITRAEIADYVTEQGNVGNSKKVEYLYVQTPNQKLENGLIFVDTPGVGSLNIEHSEITYGYLPNADVVLFVSDAQSPLTVSELKFLKKATEFCNNIIFPMTKVDKYDYKPIYESNLNKIIEYTSLPKEEINIIPVSSLAKLRYLETKNPMMLKSSNYKQLEDIIWATLSNKRAQILLTPPLFELAKEILVIKNNLKIQYDSLTQDSQTTKTMERELKKLMDEKQVLLEEGAEWKGQLQFELTKLYENVQDDIKCKMRSLTDYIKTALNSSDIVNHLDQLTSAVNDELFNLAYDAKETILSGIDQISNDTEDKLGLSLSVNTSAISNINYDKDSEIKLDIERKGNIEKSITVGRSIMMKSSGGGAISAVVGGLLGAAVGLFGGPVGVITGAQYGASIGLGLGGFLGGGKGMLDGINDLKKSDVPALNRSYTSYINQSIDSIKDMVLKTKTQISQGLMNDFNNKVKEQRNQLNQNIKDIQENMSITKEKAAEKVKIIQAQSRDVMDIELKINKLMEILKNKAVAAADVMRKMDQSNKGVNETKETRQAKPAASSGFDSEKADNFGSLRM